MRILTFLYAVLLGSVCNAQVLIGTNSSAAIEIQDTDKGIQLPQVELQSISNPSPLPSHQQGMLVFNTRIGGNVTQGVYYNTGSQWIRLSSNNGTTSNFIDFLTIGNEIRFNGAAGNNALIQKNASPGRDELQIYAGGDAYTGGSAGAGIHLYGNSDNEHDGNIALLTGPNGQGNGRMIVSGAYSDTRITIGNNNIWDFVDNNEDDAMLTLKDPDGIPAICIRGAGSSEGELTVPDGQAINFGHWSGTTFTSRFEIDSQGQVGIGTTDPNSKLEVTGAIRLEDLSVIPTNSNNHSGIYSLNGELYSFDENGNHTVISPHHFSLIQPSEPQAWSYYSKDVGTGREINVDMLKALRILEKLSGEQLVFIKE